MTSTTLERPEHPQGSDARVALMPLSESDLMLADSKADIRGLKVLDQNGEEIGEVNDLLVDSAEQRVRFIKVKSGGFLGLGAETTFIPVDAVTEVTDHLVRVNQTREYIAGAPRYNPELVQDDHYADLYGYYGYMPFWGTGYMYPAFPYYGGRIA